MIQGSSASLGDEHQAKMSHETCIPDRPKTRKKWHQKLLSIQVHAIRTTLGARDRAYFQRPNPLYLGTSTTPTNSL